MRRFYVLGACLIACSSESTPTDGGSDASADATADALQEAGNDGGPTGCNTLANTGTVIQQMYVATDPVSGDGGALPNGTYFMTAAAVYTGADGGSGPTGTTLQETLVLADGGTVERVQSAINDAGADGSPFRANGTVTLNGSNIQAHQTCPVSFQEPFTSYDSNGTKLHIYAPAAGPGNPGLMFEYTKQ